MTIAESSSQLLETHPVNGERIKLVCQGVKEETADVKTYYLELDKPGSFLFRAGQFITLELSIDGQRVYRSYTISSSPLKSDLLAVTVKQVPGGKVSNWLARHFTVGDSLWATGPCGGFNAVDIPADKYLFLSAGSGITPMMSMSRWLLDTGSNADICFIHSARSDRDIIFRDELLRLSAQADNFTSRFVLETASDITPFHGRINQEVLQQCVPDLHSRTIFVCGPAPYMESVKAMVAQAGFDMSQFHMESFSPFEPDKTQLKSEENVNTEAVSVCLSNSGQVIEIDSSELILDALEKSGNPQPSACRAGVCGACKVQALEGVVNSSSQLTLTEEEVAEGYFLSCCSTAESDLLLAL